MERLTSNKGFEEWGEIFGDEVMAAALIDRLVHHCHLVTIHGNSYRLRQHTELWQTLHAPPDPTGDERTFALSRQARLIPIVATQSVSSLRSALPGDESWRTLLQCFRTKIFLATSDEFTARAAADLCGRRDHLKAHYTLAEGSQGAHISLLTGRATASRQTVSASKSYAPHHEYIFSPRVFTELRNGQAIALPYDGLNPMPPQFCYLKPHYLDIQTSYFDHVARGLL